MSSVAAENDNNHIIVVNDTQLTYPIDRNGENHGLKIYLPAGLVKNSIIKYQNTTLLFLHRSFKSLTHL
jgi:hypothetical protein